MDGLVHKLIPARLGKSECIAYGIGDSFGAAVHIGNNLRLRGNGGGGGCQIVAMSVKADSSLQIRH